MQIPDRQIREDVTPELELNPQILLCGELPRDAITEPKQQWPMKNLKQRAKNPKRD